MAKAQAVPAEEGISRREFLYYIWGASMALFTAEFLGLLIWFMIPKFRDGQFGGKFKVPLDVLPGINEPPAGNDEGRFWLVNLDTEQSNALMYSAIDEDNPIQGVLAIYKVCTHLGCIYAWNAANDRFECPCHGSKYRLDGRRVESPAPRTLDRFNLAALDADGNILAQSEANEEGEWLPLVLPSGTASLQIDTGDKKLGAGPELLCVQNNAC
ncbi:MAG: ubiquinol-cytochrome c reductase iron-sulfur subunit [Candidatus Promineifilaceae bacterium]